MTNPDYEMHLRPEEDYEMHFDDAGLKPEQTATVTPDYETQTVRPDPGCVFSEVTVEAIPEPTEEIDITENGTVDVARYGTANVAVPVGVFPEGTENITQNGDYDVTMKETAHVEVVPDLQDKTVTPTEQTQTIEADAGYDGLDTVTVNPIPPEYVVPTGSVDITQNGQVSVSGKATANVNVPQGVFPSGTKLITQNVTGEDVTNYSAVDVAVPGPTGTKQISITANGTTTEDVTDYADAEIMVNTDPAKGLVFEDYDADGYPHSARFVGTWTTIPKQYAYKVLESGFSSSLGLFNKINYITIPDGVVELINSCFLGCNVIKEFVFPNNDIFLDVNSFYECAVLETIHLRKNVTFGDSVFYNCYSMESAFFDGEVTKITSGCFRCCRSMMLYDFSHCTEIPPLYNVAALGHATGCVIRIPAALSDTTLGTGNGWESATNWSALTDIVWEVV